MFFSYCINYGGGNTCSSMGLVEFCLRVAIAVLIIGLVVGLVSILPDLIADIKADLSVYYSSEAVAHRALDKMVRRHWEALEDFKNEIRNITRR